MKNREPKRRVAQGTQSRATAIAAAAMTVAAVGAAGIDPVPKARGALLIDLRLTSINSSPVPDSKANDSVNIGDTLTFNVVARISGTNSVQLTGNFDGQLPNTDTRNDDTVQTVVGSFASTGPLKGNFLAGTNADQGQSNVVDPFRANSWKNGASMDFDSDGDLDLGDGAPGSDDEKWTARAGAPATAVISKRNVAPQTRFGRGYTSLFVEDLGGPNSGVTADRIIDATTAELLLGELTWICTGGSGSAAINYVPRTVSDNTPSALWFEDNIVTGKTPSNGTFLIGAPVTVGPGVPEPGALGLLSLAALGLIARRNRPAP